jgi:chaperone required for assembly of F1-ATPase
MDEKAKQLLIDYKRTFGSQEGTKVFENIKKFCGAERLSFVPESPTVTAYNEGQRSVYLHIKEMLEKDLNTEKNSEIETEPEF